MPAYLLRRLIQSALILLGVSFITFFLLYILPADPVRQIAGRSATPQTVENIRQQLGLALLFFLRTPLPRHLLRSRRRLLLRLSSPLPCYGAGEI
jgi:ABC-type dipeptide/oligopeptide/nickel transport system permease component